MDLRQIQYIISVADEKSITKASEKLFITQSALNQTLLKLEHELNTPLFRRIHNEMVMTDAGRIYIDYAKKIVSLKKEAYAKINDVNNCNSGELFIGLTIERSGVLITNVFPKFHKLYPNIYVHPIEGNVISLLNLIAKQKLDIGFLTLGTRNFDGFDYEHIINEEFLLAAPVCLAVTKKHINKKTVSLRYFKNEQFILMNQTSTIRPAVDSLFMKSNFSPNILLETSNNVTRLDIVKNGLACAIIPKMYAIKNDKIKYFALPKHPQFEIVAATKKGYYVSKACSYFTKLVKDYWQTYNYISI